MEWQPIETAPKDGRSVLLSTFDGLKIAFWDEDVREWFSTARRHEHTEWVYNVTHWMPLPEPPKGE